MKFRHSKLKEAGAIQVQLEDEREAKESHSLCNTRKIRK